MLDKFQQMTFLDFRNDVDGIPGIMIMILRLLKSAKKYFFLTGI